MADLALAVEDVHGDEDRSEPQAGQEQVQERQAVGELHGEPVARTNAARGEGRHHALAARRDLAERQRLEVPAWRADLEPGLGGTPDEAKVMAQLDRVLMVTHGATEKLTPFNTSPASAL